jgi:hypothetical protein
MDFGVNSWMHLPRLNAHPKPITSTKAGYGGSTSRDFLTIAQSTCLKIFGNPDKLAPIRERIPEGADRMTLPFREIRRAAQVPVHPSDVGDVDGWRIVRRGIRQSLSGVGKCAKSFGSSARLLAWFAVTRSPSPHFSRIASRGAAKWHCRQGARRIPG